MEWYYIALTAAGIAVVLFILATLSTAALINKIIFGTRQDKNPKYKYYTPEEFDLTCEKLPVSYSGVVLSSHIYTVKPLEDCEKVVIFAHGFGAGSASYTTEIAHFAKAGNIVAATDAFGCNGSAGKNIKGFYAGAEAVIATFIAVKNDARLKGKKVILAGHSWGAYSVLAASGKIAADGVVAMSSFNKPAQCTCDNLINVGGTLKLYARLLHGWFWVMNLFKFGGNGNRSAAKAASQSKVPVLLIHGEKDRIVPFKHSAAFNAKSANVTKLILSDKKHNPYNTVAAEEKLKELSSVSDKEGESGLASFDWAQATEEDENVMAQIDRFIAGI